MAHDEDKALAALNEESAAEKLSLSQQLADAKKEIDELKMQIMWMERSYE